MTRVAIVGTHSPDWMAALEPGAPVWSLLPQVTEVRRKVPRRGRGDFVAIPLLEHHICEVPARVAALIPDARALRALADKARFRDLLHAHGLEWLAPRQIELDDPAFPCMVKRTNLHGRVGIAAAHSADQLEAMLNRNPWQGHEVLLQELVVDFDECVTHAVAVRGQVKACISYQHPRPRRPGHYGPTRAPVIIETPPVAARALEHILGLLDFSGPCSMDFAMTSDGQFKVFEINPRLGGSLMRPGNVNDLAVILSAVIAGAQRDPECCGSDRIGRRGTRRAR